MFNEVAMGLSKNPLKRHLNMKSTIPKDPPNVIKGIIESVDIRKQKWDMPYDVAKNQTIWILYHSASKDTKSLLNVFVFLLCNKTLEDLLSPDQPKE